MPSYFKKSSLLNSFLSDFFRSKEGVFDVFSLFSKSIWGKFLYAILLFFLLHITAFAQVCGTSGLDGPQNAVPPVNTYYPLDTNASLAAGSKRITLLAVPPNDPYYNLSYGSTQINSGDLILIIQMQDADIDYTNTTNYGSGTGTSGPDGLGGTGYKSLGNSGKFEYVVATSSVPLTGGTLTFRGAGTGGGCVNSYTNANATSSQGQKRFQVVRVPQYSNLVLNSNITTPPYNGSVGGLIAFDVAGTMQFNGFYVDASERGFRGGYGPVAASNKNNSTDYVLPSSSTKSVGKGEGVAGTPRYMWDGFVQVDNGSDGLPGGSYGRGAPANAGGGGNDHNSGGGGGANGGNGGLGGMGWQGAGGDVDPLSAAGRPGTALPVDYTRLIMGGGGGGGDANNATSGVKGGVGGGIILINVDKIDGVGLIKSNGGNGQAGAYGSQPDGAGGGGAGGAIFVRALATSPTANLTIEAKGGKGGSTINDTGGITPHGPGGGGGGGFIYTQVPSATIATDVSGGVSGKTNNGVGITHGAMDGSTGQASTFSTTDLPSYLQGGGSICYPQLTTTLTEQNAGPSGARNAGTTATYTLIISNDPTNGNAGNVEAWLKLPSGFTLQSVSSTLTGDASGSLGSTPNVGATGEMSFGKFNISPGDQVILTIVVNIASDAPSGVYHASAQATYLDPTRTVNDPYRKITGATNPFNSFNTTYESGGVSSVIGTNYDGDLSTATAEDVYVIGASYNGGCDAITGGDFESDPVGIYASIGKWYPARVGDSVKIVSQAGSKGAIVKDKVGEKYSLQQTVISVTPSAAYTLTFNYRNSDICGSPSASKSQVEIIDAKTNAVIVSPTEFIASNSPQIGTINFNTLSTTDSLIIKITDSGSPNPACGTFIDDVSIASSLNVIYSSSDVTCNGANDGKITVTLLTGAAAPYQISYAVDGGAYSAPVAIDPISTSGSPYVISGLAAGNYLFKIIDGNGCENIRAVSITEPPVITLSSTHIDNSCNDNSIGAIDLKVVGGTAPYTYQWTKDGTNYATTEDLNNLPPGTYQVTVTDNNGCTAQLSVDILPLTPFVLTGTNTNLTCSGDESGTITLTPSGGLAPYSFTWSDGSHDQNRTNLSAGTYSVIGKDALGCEISLSYTLTEPPAIVISPSYNPILCYGSLTDVTLNASGGTGTLSYSKDGTNYQSSNIFSALPAGDYVFYVKDANGCSTTDAFTISQPAAALALTESHNPILCNGNTSQVTLTATGGTGAYQYSKDGTNYQASNIFSGLTAGTYTFDVKDVNGCIKSINTTIGEPSAIVITESHEDVKCNGDNSGSINITVTGGTAPYTYSWSSGQNSEDLSNLTAGTYILTVNDANGCSTTKTVIISQPDQLQLNASKINVTCNGSNTGSINLSVTGGTAPYTYFWNTGATTQDIQNLTAGFYNVTVSDANGCLAAIGISITQPASAISLSETHINNTCFSENAGSINLSVSGGVGPYTYNWSNGQSTQDISGLSPGNYTVIVTDANACTATLTVTITPLAPFTINPTQENVHCNGDASGAIHLNPSGGVAPYTFSWNSGQSSADISGLIAGTYNYTATDANGCQLTGNITITQPTPIAIAETHQDVKCYGDNSGSIDVTITGGTSPYTYAWSNGQTTEDLSSLAAGTYTLTLTDANGCAATKAITIQQPAAPIAIAETHQDVKCYGDNSGSIDITITGGTSPYTYAWSNGQTTEDLSTLVAGTYTLTLIDANGCAATKAITIQQPAAALAVTESHPPILCSNQTTAISLTANGGTAAYQYSKDGSTYQSSNIFSGLIAGAYNFYVKDAHDCVATLNLNITAPADLTLAENHLPILCNEGTTDLTLAAAGGTTPYQYSKDGITYQSSNIFSGLIAGAYTFYVKDVNGCEQSIQVNLTAPSALSLNGTNTTINCHGGTSEVTLIATGGTEAYQFSKDGITYQNSNIFSGLIAGNYTFYVKDAKGCSNTFSIAIAEPAALSLGASSETDATCFSTATGSVSAGVVVNAIGQVNYVWKNSNNEIVGNTSVVNNLPAGTYTLTVNDDCASLSNSVIIKEPTILSLTGSASAISCNGGMSTVTLVASGGTASYQFSKDGTTYQGSNIFSGLAAGNYTFYSKDAHDCTKSLNITINEPTPIAIAETHQEVKCYGDNTGSIDITVTGGTAPYSYNWSNSSTTEDTNNLTAGTYTVTVTDNNGCSAQQSIAITQPAAALSIAETHQDVKCYGDNTGSIDITVTGGTAPYTYSWSSGQNTEDISTLVAGTYIVTVTDNNGCSVQQSISITQPAAPIAIAETHQEVKCYGDNTGSIDITVTGGTAPYSYNWSNGQTTEDLSTLAAGTYTLTLTDANGCSATKAITIQQPAAPINIVETHEDVSCFGSASGSIQVNVSGGTAPYTYAWSDGSKIKNLSALAAGDYTLTVTDAMGCSSVLKVTIQEPSAPLQLAENHQDILCYGDNSGSITLTLKGGTAPYTYLWSNGLTTKDISGLTAGTYSVVVTDAKGCTIGNLVKIDQPAAPLSIEEAHQNVSCFGGQNGSISINVLGGTAPYRYAWGDGSTLQRLSNLAAGNYQLKVTDKNGCSATKAITIQQPAAPIAIAETHQDVKCYGDNSGSIDVTITGGTSPYTYAWSNGQTTEDLSNLVAGTYTLTLTDANGCTATKAITIQQPAAPINITETHQDVKCYGDNSGSIEVTITGGTAPYSYSWNNGKTGEKLSNLTAGNYTVSITDAQGCSISKSILIQQPSAPLALSETHVNNACYGDKKGTASITVTGGTAPYTYLWNNGERTAKIVNLSGGTYQCTVTDQQGCTAQISVLIEPLKPFLVKDQVEQIQCNGAANGSIQLSLSGGGLPYQVTWSNGQTGEKISELAPGTYTYTAIDHYGCSIQKSITITEPESLAIQFKFSPTSCKFTKDGAILAKATGGTPPYQYYINGKLAKSSGFMDFLAAGTYQITVVDAHQCIYQSAAEVLPGNCAPNAANDSYQTLEDTPITINTPGVVINDSDPDNDSLKVDLYTAKDPNGADGVVNGKVSSFKTLHGKVELNPKGSFTYTPDKNFNGVEKFVYEVSDGSLMSNFAIVTIVVTAVNDPPIANPDYFTTPEDVPITDKVTNNDTDPENDPLNYTLVTPPAQGDLTFNADGTFNYQGAQNFNGIATFIYQVCDPSGLCDTAKVTILITPVNDPPVANDDKFYVQFNGSINNTVTTNDSDVDNDPLTWTLLTQPVHGNLIFKTDGTFSYQPNFDFKGIDTYTYRTCDPSGLCDEATVTLIVQPTVTVNLTPAVGEISEGDSISITAKLTESIVEDATITLNFGGTATLQSDYTLSGNYQTITILGGQDSTTQKFVIHAINDAVKDMGEQVMATITQVDSKYVLIGTGSVVTIDDVYPKSIPLGPDENPDINPDPLVSPNGDGQGNETFVIYNISKYPNNEVVVFNRWGNEVFRIKGYNNEDRSFKGVANVGILTNTNKDLVNGVYYYIIYTEVDNKKKLNKGYLILKR